MLADNKGHSHRDTMRDFSTPATPLPTLVCDTSAIIERHCIETALQLANGRRTAAAELLGLSRQSLYMKLSRYGMDGEIESSPGESG